MTTEMRRKIKKLSSLGEFAWLRKLLPRLYWPSSLHSQLCIGPGDDAGAVRITPGKVLVATTDAMVEGIHFEKKWFSWEALGYKIIAVNLSDLAAMGHVKPLSALISVSFPGDTPVDIVNKFYKGLESCAQRWKIGLLGGDTVGSTGGWFVSATALGEANPRELIRRKGAKPGDYLIATGDLGLAAAGLEVLQSGNGALPWAKPLIEAFAHPQPRFAAGSILGRNHWATSLIDISDGLEASIRLLANASGRGAEVELVRLPVSNALTRWARMRGRHPWDYALKGGEDYELLFTVRPPDWENVRRRIPGAVRIGKVLAKGKGCWAVLPGRRLRLKGYGFAHFAPA